MPRTITHSQYAELRHYADHDYRWTYGGPLRSLVSSGLIAPARHDRDFYSITEAGTLALLAYRRRYRIVVLEPCDCGETLVDFASSEPVLNLDGSPHTCNAAA